MGIMGGESWCLDMVIDEEEGLRPKCIVNVEEVTELPPDTGGQAGGRNSEMFLWVDMCEEVMLRGYPNAWGPRIPVPSGWNVPLLHELLCDYGDKEVAEFMQFGWPVSRPPTWPDPVPTFSNHAGAVNWPSYMNKYIDKECKYNAIIGPFDGVPFSRRVGVSPLSTRAKRDSDDRRVIMDLSWPPGLSVNDGIAKNQFMGFACKLSFPTIDVIAERVFRLGPGAFLFKIDLSRFFRQIPLDPGDYSLMCFTWGGKIWFDRVSPMGLRSAPQFAQRISDALKYIHNMHGYFLFNYIDDFLGAEPESRIRCSFDAFIQLLDRLGVERSEDKTIPPTQVINCIGTLVSAEDQTLQVTLDRQYALWVELHTWLYKATATLKQVQILVGKLQFICACVRPGRLFMSRILQKMQGNPQEIAVDIEFKKDINWWIKFLPMYSGVSIMWALGMDESGVTFATDASLTGLGAVCNSECISVDIQGVQDMINANYTIVHLELLAIIIAVKTWAEKLRGIKIKVECDNSAVVEVVNSGRSHCSMLQELMRELMFTLAVAEMEIRTVHVFGKNNVVPDLLSRAHGTKSVMNLSSILSKYELTHVKVNKKHFKLMHEW